jgi:phosphoribosylanthranilate isomerase
MGTVTPSINPPMYMDRCGESPRGNLWIDARVKICGITRYEDAIIAERYGADAIGVVMNSSSPRNVTWGKAEEIFASVGPYITRVVVTHTKKRSELRNILHLRPDAIQISHGFPWISGTRLIRIHAPGDPLRSDCDAVLIDGSRGNGIPFDPLYARKILETSPVPVILAGGLTPETVRDVVHDLQPYAVDVCTGVERAPGIKDAEKIQVFIREAHRAYRA